MQLIVQPMSPAQYAAWRREFPHPTPPVEGGYDVLVVLGVVPEDAQRFLAGGKGRVVGAAGITPINPALEEAVRLREAVAAWLEHHSDLVLELAPPIVQRVSAARPKRSVTRVETLGHSWDLAARPDA